MNPFLPHRFVRTALAAALSSALAPCTAAAVEPGPVGADFKVTASLVNTNQRSPAAASDASGNFVVVWQATISGTTDIRAQRYNAVGQRQGSEILVNTLTALHQTSPAVAMDAAGNFIVTWTSDVGAGNLDIRAQRFNAAGVAQGSEILVNGLTTGAQDNSTVSVSALGAFAVAWDSVISGSQEIRVQRLNALGTPLGAEFQANTRITDNQRFPSIALDLSGDFVVAWEERAPYTSEIHVRRFTASGLARDTFDFKIGQDAGNQNTPDVAVDAEGNFVVAYAHTDGTQTGAGIYAQRFDALGEAQGAELRATAVADLAFQDAPAVSMDADGDFVIAWQSFELDSNSIDIRARRFSADGLAQGENFLVNTTTTNQQEFADVALDADGDFVAVWESYTSALSNDGEIRGRRFQGPELIDVGLFQTDSVDPAPVGAPLSYTLVAGNRHPPALTTGLSTVDNAIGVANSLRVIDLPPPGSTSVTATGSNWVCGPLASARVVCDYLLPLPAGEEASPITVTLTPPDSAGALISNVARASATQLDPDPLNNRDVERTRLVCAESQLRFTAASLSVNETGGPINPGSAPVLVERVGGSCGPARVQFDTSAVSALPGVDFTDVGGTLDWADGETGAKLILVPVNNDALDENNEQFLVSLSQASGAVLAAPSRMRVTLLDDDASPRVNFASAAQTVPEAPALATVTARLAAISGRDVTVPLSFGGTASNGVDYFPGAITLVIPAGQIAQTVDLEIAGDTSDEADETVIVGMGAVSGATVGSLNTHTLTITDDDAPPTASFTAPTTSALEGVTRGAVVSLSAASASTVTVPFTVSGTAGAGDYTLNRSSPLSFPPGTTSLGIQIAAPDDLNPEADETVILTLGTPTNATLGLIGQHTRTILNNDAP